MTSTVDIEQALGLPELRARFLAHSRAAYALLPPLEAPKILDIGCGQGLQTLELARLSGGEVVGIDVDEAALSVLRDRLADTTPRPAVSVVNTSLYQTGAADGAFDLLWEEGVLHLLDDGRSFPECHRLLRPGGFLVMHERIDWFEARRATLSEHGFDLADRYLLPEHCWWTDYGKPLAARIRALRQSVTTDVDPAALDRYARQAADLEADPSRFDCGFYLLRKRG
jgi:SAM-dependent methyltransferase